MVSVILVTYCSRDKSREAGDLPALRRYASRRIDAVHGAAIALGAGFRILSGRFGLLAAADPIPWYDNLLTSEEAAAHAARVLGQLRAAGALRVVFFSRPVADDPLVAPYHEAISRACAEGGIDLVSIDVEDRDLTPERLAARVRDLTI